MQKINLSTIKCQNNDGKNEELGTTCQSIVKNDSILSFSNMHVNHISTISIELKGSEGQISMWTTKHSQEGKITIFPTSKNGSNLKLVLNDVYEHNIFSNCFAEDDFCSISFLLIFPNVDFCVQNVNPKVYFSRANGVTIYIGTFNLHYFDPSKNRFQFMIVGNLSFGEVLVTLKGNNCFTLRFFHVICSLFYFNHSFYTKFSYCF